MKRIMIIDDEPFARQVFRHVIENMGKEVEIIEAADGNEAWAKIQDEKLDLLVVDINLPFINGIELIEKFRITMPDLNEVPCIVVTANTATEIQEKIKNLGVVEVISKIDISSRNEASNPLVAVLNKYL